MNIFNLLSGGDFKPPRRTNRKQLRRHKFNAKPTTREWPDNSKIKFQSTMQARYFDRLVLATKTGSLLFFLMEVPIKLPGGVTYRVDFVEFWRDGAVNFVDVKGRKTPQYIDKKKQVEALYPIEILEVTRI